MKRTASGVFDAFSKFNPKAQGQTIFWPQNWFLLNQEFSIPFSTLFWRLRSEVYKLRTLITSVFVHMYTEPVQ